MNASAPVKRSFLPNGIRIESWSDVEPFFEDLDHRELTGTRDLVRWLRDKSEFEAFYAENLAWRYIRMTTDTRSESRKKAYQFFVNEIQPNAAPYFDRFNRKLVEAPGLQELGEDPAYAIMLRNARKSIELFREENIPLEAKMANKAQEYGAIAGKMTISYDGKTYTLPQAGLLLEDENRTVRESVFKKVGDRRLEDAEVIDSLMDDLIALRQKIAANAGYANYRDFKFDELHRFDYTPKDCFRFHESVEKVIVPLVEQIHEKRRKALHLESLKPFDLQVDFRGEKPLRPFSAGEELIEKGIQVMGRVNRFFGECVESMQKLGHLDLESRDGKAPGGYNYPLYESGYPFIFMNAAGTQNDLITFVHESGHAVHSVLSQDLPLTEFKSCPSEVAELASMSMELVSMESWDVFYPDPSDLRRAQLDQLERAVESLTWIATIDCFQHWMYENPNHSRDERTASWRKIYQRFHPSIDWAGLEQYRDALWQKQLHLFEVPFYYIEYGMAQLGAIAIFRNFRNDASSALEGYLSALKLGNTRTIPEIYCAANIRFDFSEAYIHELSSFISEEIALLD